MLRVPHSSMHRRAFYPICAVIFTAPAPLQAQDVTRVSGRVVNVSGGIPLPDATVIELGATRATLSSASGAFALPLMTTPSRIVVARLGFAPETLSVTAGDDVHVRMRAAPLIIDPVIVRTERAPSAASSRLVGALDVQLRPRESAQELLQLVPGLVIAQHAGGGKAEQIFLRGFDADHGTDVALAVDGVPVNMVSHAHGQGYADLHFVLPEVVERVDVRKGPYNAADGDFATAGAVELRTMDRLESATASVRAGENGTARVFAGIPLGGAAAQSGGWLAGALHTSDGPFDAPQKHRRANAQARWTAPLGGADLVLSASAFGARWDASGQIPERAVRDGIIGRFGSLDDSEGGRTSRMDASVALRSSTAGTGWHARAFATRYDFTLFSNFTFLLNDEENGDGIVQNDDRVILGVLGDWSRKTTFAGLPARYTIGAGARSDRISIDLGRQAARRRLGDIVHADIAQDHGYVWADQDIDVADAVSVRMGVRVDAFRFDVSDRTSQVVSRARVGPKLGLSWRAARATSLFANVGSGFHSNDARAVVTAAAGEEVLPRALGGELGVRHIWQGGTIGLAAWWLDLESELVYVGDEGTTEPSGATRRMGVDADARLRITSWLWADMDVSLARGRFRDVPLDRNRIPLAPRVTSSGGLTLRDVGALTAGVRYRAVGNRPADETNAIRARGHALLETFATWRFGRLEATVTAENLLDADWNEAQFATTSRLQGERMPVTELHFTPGTPRIIQLGLTYRLR